MGDGRAGKSCVFLVLLDKEAKAEVTQPSPSLRVRRRIDFSPRSGCIPRPRSSRGRSRHSLLRLTVYNLAPRSTTKIRRLDLAPLEKGHVLADARRRDADWQSHGFAGARERHPLCSERERDVLGPINRRGRREMISLRSKRIGRREGETTSLRSKRNRDPLAAARSKYTHGPPC
jgi:hypothetical protein